MTKAMKLGLGPALGPPDDSVSSAFTRGKAKKMRLLPKPVGNRTHVSFPLLRDSTACNCSCFNLMPWCILATILAMSDLLAMLETFSRARDQKHKL